MIEVWKETLLPGTMVDPKTGLEFTITPGDITDAARNVRRMAKRKGLRVPIIWEHLDVEENDPEEWKANYAKHTVGRLGDARKSTREDVAAGRARMLGSLMVRHDIYDEEDARQIRKTGGVSPKIYRGYLDSTGEELSGVTIAHSAITPSPVQWWQAPFSIELSDGEALCLAYPHPDGGIDSENPLENAVPCPAHTGPVAAWAAWCDATPDPDAEPNSGAVELSATDDPEATPVADEPKNDAPKKGDESGGGGGKKSLADVIKALKDHLGLNIPDGVEDEHGLWIAVMAQPGGGAADEPEDEAPVESAPGTEPAPGGPPMLMSTTDANPKKRERAQKYAAEEREVVKARVAAALKNDGVTGRDPLAARKLLRRCGAVELSFTADYEPAGKDWDRLLADVARYEATKPAFKLRADGSVDLSATVAVDRPAPGAGADRQREEDACVAEQAALARKHSPVQKAQ